MPETLAELAYRHATSSGEHTLPRASLHVAEHPARPVPTLYRPMCGMVLRGAKHVTIGNRELRYDAAHYFIGAIDVPAEVAITEASPEEPYVAARLAIDLDMLTDLTVGMGLDGGCDTAAFAVELVTPELLDAWHRYIKLLDAPDEIGAFAPLIEREILLRLLRGPRGVVLRQSVRTDSRIWQIRRTIAHLRANFTRTVRNEELIDVAGMSAASFHRHFRAATAMSPLQYQKALRLQEARRRLTADPDAAAAAYAVGYESASQFSRDYTRMFGRPPGRDATMLRATAR